MKGPAATRFRKGACANCGSITHEAKSCVERPRKVGAKFTGKDIRPDEVVTDLKLDYAAKHDKYNGYNSSRYSEVVERFNKAEILRRQIRTEQEAAKFASEKLAQAKAAEATVAIEGKMIDDDEFKVDDTQDNVGQFSKIDGNSHRSVRDLRIREDTAKYLLNLNVDAPFYDPKSHSMRADPRVDHEKIDTDFMGDNYNRFTGDTATFYEMQKFAWETSEVTHDATTTHLEALPSMAATQFEQKQKQLLEARQIARKQIFEKYGGEEHLQVPPVELLEASSVIYTEYSPNGHLLIDTSPKIPKSKYEEDIFPGNHTSVWGSYYYKGKWGYQCCHQLTKNSYCIPINNQNVNSETDQIRPVKKIKIDS